MKIYIPVQQPLYALEEIVEFMWEQPGEHIGESAQAVYILWVFWFFVPPETHSWFISDFAQ